MYTKTEGPELKLTKSCFQCQYEVSQTYHVQSDSGVDIYCAHPDIGKKGIGNEGWRTPQWCPCYPASLMKFYLNIKNEIEILFASPKGETR